MTDTTNLEHEQMIIRQCITEEVESSIRVGNQKQVKERYK